MNNKSHLDHEALSELKDVMDDEFDILISTFLQDSRERIAHLMEAARSKDAETFSKMAHSLKGSCINIGAPILGEHCLTAERAGKEGEMAASEAQVGAIEAEFRVVERELQAYLQAS